MKSSTRVKFIRNYQGIGSGETRIFNSDTANELIAMGVAVETFEIKPTGPKEIKPAGPSETKVELGGKKKVKTPKS